MSASESSSSSSSRQYDLIIVGATGFTGTLALQYLAKAHGPPEYPLKYAIAGRSQSKMDFLVNSLDPIFKENMRHQESPTNHHDHDQDRDHDDDDNDKDKLLNKLSSGSGGLTGVSGRSNTKKYCVDTLLYSTDMNLDDMMALTSKTKVIATFVGPFSLYGERLVEACIATGTHYVDSTGENNFVQKLVLKYQKKAEEKGTLIVPCCGFDYVPADMAICQLKQFLEDQEQRCSKQFRSIIQTYELGQVWFSSGTMMSMVSLLSSIKPTDFLRGVWSQRHLMIRRYVPEQALYNVPFVMTGSIIQYMNWAHKDNLTMVSTSTTTQTSTQSSSTKSTSTPSPTPSPTILPFIAGLGYSGSFYSGLKYISYYVHLFFFLIFMLFPSFVKVILAIKPDEPSKKIDDYVHVITTAHIPKTETSSESEDLTITLKWSYLNNECYAMTGMLVTEAALTIAMDSKLSTLKQGSGGILPPSKALGVPYLKRIQRFGQVQFREGYLKPADMYKSYQKGNKNDEILGSHQQASMATVPKKIARAATLAIVS